MASPPYHLRNDPEVYPPPYKSTLYNDLWRLSNLDPLGTLSSRWRLSEMSLDGPYRDEAALAGWVGSANARWDEFCSAFERTQSFIEIGGLTLLATIETPSVTRFICPLQDTTIREYTKDTSSLGPNLPKLHTTTGVVNDDIATECGGYCSKASLVTQSSNNTTNVSITSQLTPAEVHDTQPTYPKDRENILATSNQSNAKHKDSEIDTSNVETASTSIHPRHRRDSDPNMVMSKVMSPEKRRPFNHAEPKDQLNRNSKTPPLLHSHTLQSFRPQPRCQSVIITKTLVQSSIATCLPEEHQRLPASLLEARQLRQRFRILSGLGPIHFAFSGDPNLHGFLPFSYTPTAGEGSGNGNHLSTPGGEVWPGRGHGIETYSALYQNLDAAREYPAEQLGSPPRVSTARTAYNPTSALAYWQPRIYPDPPPPINAPVFCVTARSNHHHNKTCATPSLLGQENHTPNAFNQAAPPPPLPAQPIGTSAPGYLSQNRALHAELALPGYPPAFEVSPHLGARTEPSSGAKHFSRSQSPLATPVDRSASVIGIVPPSDSPAYEARRISIQNISPPLTNSGATSEQKRTKRRHQCKMCEKSYTKPYLLRDHEATHIGGPKPHPCSFGGCSAAFASRSNMKKHFNKEHHGRGSSQHVPESTSEQARRGVTEKTPVAGPSAHDPAFGADFQHSGQATYQSGDAAVKKYARFRHRR